MVAPSPVATGGIPAVLPVSTSSPVVLTPYGPDGCLVITAVVSSPLAAAPPTAATGTIGSPVVPQQLVIPGVPLTPASTSSLVVTSPVATGSVPAVLIVGTSLVGLYIAHCFAPCF